MLQALPLGRLLVSAGLVSQAKLDEVLAVQKTDARRLGELLVERGLVRPHALAQLLSHQLSCPWVSLQRVEVARKVLDLVPRQLAIKHHVIPIYLRGTEQEPVLYVATDDPTDDVALADCARAIGNIVVKPMVALTSEVRDALERFYGLQQAPAKSEPRVDVARPKPPLPQPPPESAEEIEVEDEPTSDPPLPLSTPPAAERLHPRAPKALVLNAPPRFLEQVRSATTKLAVDIVEGALESASTLVALHQPCAIVVTDEVYAFDRAGLSRMALDADALLVVWSDDVEGKQLEPLLDGAVKRWHRSSYEKGAIVEERYELLRDLGGRLPGSRWEVRHVRTGRKSVLKIGLRTPGDETDAIAVRREELALARVHHPGAVDLRDAGRTDLGDPYVVIEALEGRTLEGLTVARGALPSSEACAIVRQVAEILDAAHAENVTHGDVRAENVLLVRDGYGVEHARLVQWEAASVIEGKLSPKRDIAGLLGCLFQALVGRAKQEDEDPSAAPLGNVLAASFGSVKEVIAALDAAAPSAREGSHVLEAKRSMRAPAQVEPTSASEQRRHRRAPYRTPVRLEVAGLGAVDGRSEDISIGGLFVVTKSKLPEGTQVVARFALPIDGKVVSETGVVKWSRGKGDALAVGVELASPNTETTKQIERYVAFMSTEP